MKTLARFTIAILFCVAAFAQTTLPMNWVKSAPGGNCSNVSIPQYNYTTGDYWSCRAPGNAPPNWTVGVWTKVTPPSAVVAGDGKGGFLATNISASLKIITGTGTLVSGTPSTFALTGISPAFTSSSSYTCVAQDTTTVANAVGVLAAGYVSGSAVTFTGPATNTDVFRYTCVGN